MSISKELLERIKRLREEGYQPEDYNKVLSPKEVIEVQKHINSRLQSKSKIKEDGVFGPNTLRALDLTMSAMGESFAAGMDVGDTELETAQAAFAQTKGGMKEPITKQLLNDVNTFGSAGVTGLKAAASLQQLKQGNKGLANLQAPGPVMPQQTNRGLQGLIQKYSSMFNQGGDPAQAALQNQMNNQAYNDQLSAVRNTGQAGLIAAGGQKAYLDRLRASQQIMAGRRQEQQQYGQLLGGAIGQQISESGNQVAQRMQNMQLRDIPLYERQSNQFNAKRNAGLMGLDNQLNAAIPAVQNIGSYLVDKPTRKITLEKYRRAK
jgi:hypothetical protein